MAESWFPLVDSKANQHVSTFILVVEALARHAGHMDISNPNIRKATRVLILLLGLALLAGLLYWILPVAVQTRLSADHVRRVFALNDVAPVAGHSLSSLWTLLLMTMKACGLGVGAQTFATAAALSGWVLIFAIAILSLFVPWGAVILVALAPAVLWTAVVPNGFSLSLLFLALVGLCSNPQLTFENNRKRWTFGAVIDGIACALTPLAWFLVIWRETRSKTSKQNRIRRAVLFVVGFSIPMAVAILLEGDGYSFAKLPSFTALRELMVEDTIGAGRVFIGGFGEIAIGLFAGLCFVLGILMSPGWCRPLRSARPRLLSGLRLGLLIWVAYGLSGVIGHPGGWKLAHPGWNTILEDFAQNVERSSSGLTVAIVQSASEEAALRYVDELLSKHPAVVPVRTLNLFEASTVSRLQAREPKFNISEAKAAVDSPNLNSSQDSAEQIFNEGLLIPNTKRGVTFWLASPPDRNEGFETKFIANGVRVKTVEGPTRFINERDALRTSFVRAQPELREYLAGPSIETTVFARYAAFHIAIAHIIEREKKTSDWKLRARGEYYAALKKVQWLKELYPKVCSIENPAAKKEPLDVCKETAWYYAP
jgi:hypothetical protein